MNSEFRYRGYWIPFPRPVPAVVGTAWNDGDLRSICISSEWLPYVLGAIQVLCRRETWYGDPDDIEFSVVQANHILTNWEDTCLSGIMFQQTTPCLLEYSLDGGTTWQGMYDGQLCINENIADGTLAAGTTANPSAPVEIDGCVDYYCQVQEQTDFVLPTTVSTGDVITISEVAGAWADGWAGNLWYCYDGSAFVLGVCISGSNPAKSGDPLQTAEHQQLIIKIGSTYYDALAGPITVPSGVDNALVALLPNNGSARANGTGVVKAKVNICNNSQWCYEWTGAALNDWTKLATGDNGQGFGSFATTVWNTSCNVYAGNSYEAIVIEKSFASRTIIKVEIERTISVNHNALGMTIYDAANTNLHHDDGSGTKSTWEGSSDTTTKIWFNFDAGYNPAGTSCLGGAGQVTKIKIWGLGTNPFGSNNCT